MKKTIASFLLICTLAFADKNEDLTVLLEKTYLTPNSDLLLSMFAMEAIGDKTIESDELVQQFKENFYSENLFAKLAEPYNSLFTEEEIHELRAIHENPTYLKYMQQMQTFQDNFQVIRDEFKELADNFVVVNKKVAAASNMLEITGDNFDLITQSELPVVLDINAKWCNPCKLMNPIMDQLSVEFQGKVQFAKADFDSNRALADQLGATSLPTILFFKPGQSEPAVKNVGYMDKNTFRDKISAFIADDNE